jgi:N-hydroxyarylamine O-acetyltransferase
LNLDAYLSRLNYHGHRAPTPATLCALHRAHLYAVPFENLDIGLGRPLSLDVPALFDKVVHRRRGGFCYELNGLFAALLTALGFDVTLLSARVFNDGHFGPEFDHLALLVQAPVRANDSITWLADVGFGDCFIEPLRFEPGEQVHTDRDRAYRLSHTSETWVLEERRGADAYQPAYSFTLQPRRLADFGPMCHFQQTSPASGFTRRRVCTLATPTGRTSIRDDKLILHDGAHRTETDLPDHAAFTNALKTHFGIDTL